MDWSTLPLSRATVDRAAERRREEGLIATLRRDPTTRVVVVHDGRLATVDQGGLRLDLVPAPELDRLDDPGVLWFFLGQDRPGPAPGGQPTRVSPAGHPGSRHAYLAVVVPDPGAARADMEGIAVDSPEGALVRSRTWSHLREIGAALDARDAGLAATAVALASWHSSHGRCAQCGEPTEVVEAGWVRRCALDGTEHYPRTDPAIIVTVIDDEDRVLLGHAAHWPPGRFSTLAGYVEPGESAEQAVRREVAEETNVQLASLEYLGSQPWPFPGSLMLGYTARAATTEIRVDGVEVTEARWFSREELARAVHAGEVQLPMRSSIAHALLTAWYGDALPGT